LSLDRKQYDLGEGRVFLLKEDGDVKQLSIDPLPIIRDEKHNPCFEFNQGSSHAAQVNTTPATQQTQA